MAKWIKMISRFAQNETRWTLKAYLTISLIKQFCLQRNKLFSTNLWPVGLLNPAVRKPKACLPAPVQKIAVRLTQPRTIQKITAHMTSKNMFYFWDPLTQQISYSEDDAYAWPEKPSLDGNRAASGCCTYRQVPLEHLHISYVALSIALHRHFTRVQPQYPTLWSRHRIRSSLSQWQMSCFLFAC